MSNRLLNAVKVISDYEERLLAQVTKSLSLSAILAGTLKDFCKDVEGGKSAKDLLKDHAAKISEASKQSIKQMGEMLTDFDAILQSQHSASLALAMIKNIAQAEETVSVPALSPVLPADEAAITAELGDQQVATSPDTEAETATASAQKDGIID